MKIIHLSDPHIYIDKIHGIDPVSKFKKALNHIKNNHDDADDICRLVADIRAARFAH